MVVEGRTTLCLIGPGVTVPCAPVSAPMLISGATVTAVTESRLALLGDGFLVAVRHWPWIAASLHARALEHSQRLTAQLAISHLPRVENRLLALMWLLADRWGRVTPAGVRLELQLSHEVIGGLIGAAARR